MVQFIFVNKVRDGSAKKEHNMKDGRNDSLQADI